MVTIREKIYTPHHWRRQDVPKLWYPRLSMWDRIIEQIRKWIYKD